MTSLRTSLLIAAVLAPAIAAAQSASPTSSTPAGFAQHKQMELSRIAAHLQIMQTLQTCVQSAADHAAIKACNETAHAAIGHHGR